MDYAQIDLGSQLSLCQHATNRKEAATAAFVDVAKAFERVWHLGLLPKVLSAGVTQHLPKIIK